MISFMTDTVTVVRPTEWINERGDLFPNWDTASRVDVSGCQLQPMATDEVHFSGTNPVEGGVARQGVVTRWKLFFPPSASVEPHDRVEYDGATYEVDGQPQSWPAPTGSLEHGEVVLRRFDG